MRSKPRPNCGESYGYRAPPPGIEGQKMVSGRALEAQIWRDSRALSPLIRVIANFLTLRDSSIDRWERQEGNQLGATSNFFQNQSLLALVTLENPPPPL